MGNSNQGSGSTTDIRKLKKKYSLGRCFDYVCTKESVFQDFVELVLKYEFDNFMRKTVIILCTYMKKKRKRSITGNYVIRVRDFFGGIMGEIKPEPTADSLQNPEIDLAIEVTPSKGVIDDDYLPLPIKLTEARLNFELENMGRTEITVRSYVAAIKRLIEEFEQEERRRFDLEGEEMMKNIASPGTPTSPRDFGEEESSLL